MAAPKGNEFYKINPDEFKRPVAYTPTALMDKWNEYVEWWSVQRWNLKDFIKSGDFAGKIIDLPTQPPMTIGSFCVYAKISRTTFINYKKGKTAENESTEAYLQVCSRIEEACAQQMIEGAAVGVYKENLTARLLNIADKQETKVEAITWNETKTYTEPKSKVKPTKKK